MTNTVSNIGLEFYHYVFKIIIESNIWYPNYVKETNVPYKVYYCVHWKSILLNEFKMIQAIELRSLVNHTIQ